MATIRRQAVGVLILVGLACLATARDEKPPAASLQVSDGAGKVVALGEKEWAKLPRGKVEVKGKGEKTDRYEGVPLVEILRFAGIDFSKHPRGRAADYLLVEGSDGYRAVLALAEVDPSLTDRVVLLADRLEGKPLPETAGPYRLVVAGDKLPTRWVKQVVRVGVRRPAEEAPRKK